MDGSLFPILVFALVYLAIAFELINKAVAALLGVTVLLIAGVVDEHGAAAMINFETLMLLLGMMILVAIIKKTGLFTFLSVEIAHLTKGSPLKILLLFSTITASLSALLDNVTTVLIIIPIVIELTRGMGLDPKIYIVSQAMVSNVGGTSTLIGDPPNIIIGSEVGLGFNQFIVNLIVPVVIAFSATLLYIWLLNRSAFRPICTDLTKIISFQLLLEKIRFDFLSIKLDRVFITKSLCCFGVVLLLFVTQTVTHLSPGLIALLGALVLFVISKVHVDEILEEVEWSTLLFFAGLFILVGALESYGVLEWIAHNIFLKVGTNPYVVVLFVLWVAGIASGFLDNVPFTIAMIPVVRLLSDSVEVPGNLLWWALALGACFGGNATLIGSSANIVTVGIARQHAVDISFLEFMKTGGAITVISLLLASAYLSAYLWILL